MRVALAVLLVVATAGCTHLRVLQIQPDDSATAITEKVAGRCVLAPLTLGSSEVVYACARNRAAEQRTTADQRAQIWQECEDEGVRFFEQIAYEAGRSVEPLGR